MDVKCERCQTEYEFDDALVSGRGTTVKCTNCGHKFKIKRGEGDLADDYWNVTTGDGRTLVFTSLRELQRAIQGYLVERNDRLSRGGLPPKAIGQIPELAPFFEQREASKKGAGSGVVTPGSSGAPQRSLKTQDGLGPGVNPPAVAVGGQPQGQNTSVRPRMMTRPEFPGPPPSSDPSRDPPESIGDEQASDRGKSTLIGTGPLSDQEAIPRPGPAAGAPPPPRPKSTPPPVPTRGREPMHTVPMQRPSLPGSSPPPVPAAGSASPKPPVPTAAAAANLGSTQPSAGNSNSKSERPPGQVVIRSNPPPPLPKKASTPPPAAAPEPAPRQRSLLSQIEDERKSVIPDSYDSVPELPQSSRRRPVGGFIVAVVVLAGLLTMGAVWAQKNLAAFGAKPAPSAPAVDPRVASFLTSGEKALADGNLDLAKENFDKASALAEKDPHVLLALAHLAAVRADVPWLKTRLLPADAADDQKIAKSEVSELSAQARKAADDALAVAPDDPAALRAKMDALRIGGDRDGARALVPKIAASSTQPESAYVLAALDLADPEPLWSGLIERLRTAAGVETGPGRARAALVYALARSGDQAGAKAEVDRLAAMPRPHPLLPLLRTFAEKASPAKDGGVAAAEPATSSTKPGAKPAVGGGPAPAGGIPSDPRDMLVKAEKARQKGDYDAARTLYSAAVEKNPNDSEALNGLAVLDYAQHNLDGARASYKRVLAINPNYMPSLVGLADVEWDSGNKDAAAKMYKDIVDLHPEGSYPARVKQRSEGGGG